MREIMLILHFVGLTMGLGTSFAHAFLGIVTSKMTADEATKFRLHSLVLSKMGNTGIVFLIVSGLYLITPYWNVLPSLPLLILKLALVVILVVLIAMINLSTKKAEKGDPEVQLKKMEQLGKMTLLIGSIIVVLAVYIFH
ncbi:MAG TPA: hypothetical protein VK666_17700 [Chryseolinea sp.]|nr:hypothetical protein [Chryseolinea sp.]